MSDITIRLATVDDVATIHELLMQLIATLGKLDTAKGSENDLKTFGFGDRPCFEALIAYAGESAVGLAIYFSEYSTWMGTPGVYVQDLYVSSRLRGSGLGRKLIDAVRERSRTWGARYIKLSVYDGNEAAISFYQHLGFALRHDEQTLILWDL